MYRAGDPEDRPVRQKVFDDTDGPNGICFSPDYKQAAYLADFGSARQIWVFDLDGRKPFGNGKRAIQLDILKAA